VGGYTGWEMKTNNNTSIEYQSAPWQWGWESVGVISSGVLSILLIGFTIWLAIRQNRIQEKIAKDQDDLQKQISDRDVKVQNYQHRARCYLQIIEASLMLARIHSSNIPNIIHDNPINPESLGKLDYVQSLMLKTKAEAKFLFSPELLKKICILFECYAEYFQQTGKFMMTPQKVHEQIKDIDFDHIIGATRYPDALQKIKSISPRLALLLELHDKIQGHFKSEEFNDLLIKETKAE
jgi:hypothetical protein